MTEGIAAPPGIRFVHTRRMTIDDETQSAQNTKTNKIISSQSLSYYRRQDRKPVIRLPTYYTHVTQKTGKNASIKFPRAPYRILLVFLVAFSMIPRVSGRGAIYGAVDGNLQDGHGGYVSTFPESVPYLAHQILGKLPTLVLAIYLSVLLSCLVLAIYLLCAVVQPTRENRAQNK